MLYLRAHQAFNGLKGPFHNTVSGRAVCLTATHITQVSKSVLLNFAGASFGHSLQHLEHYKQDTCEWVNQVSPQSGLELHMEQALMLQMQEHGPQYSGDTQHPVQAPSTAQRQAPPPNNHWAR